MRKNRARLQVLWYICQFSLGREVAGEAFAGLRSGRFHETRTPSDGGLVAVHSMQNPDWYLAWVHGFSQKPGHLDVTYTLESLETGEIVDWSNVSLWQYDMSTVCEHPEWRWTDAQFELKDLWNTVCYGDGDAYIVLPVQPSFSDDGLGVTLETRIRFNMGENPPSQYFDDWQALTKDDLLEFYEASVKHHENRKPQMDQS